MASFMREKPTYKQCEWKAIERNWDFIKLDMPYGDGVDTFRYELEDNKGVVHPCRNLSEVWDELNAGVL